MLFSFSTLKQLYCPRRFKLYTEYKLGTLPAPELEFGSRQHEDFEQRLINNTPANEWEKNLLDKLYRKYDYFEVEKYLKNEEYKIHGVIDVLMVNLESHENGIIEIKTGRWDREQLYMYKVLTNAKTIYILNPLKQTIEEIEVDENEALAWIIETVKKAETILNTDIENVPMRPSLNCVDCPFAKHCSARSDIEVASAENLPAAIDLYYQLKARLKMLEKSIKEAVEQNGGFLKVGNYIAKIEETPYYRLSKTLSKEDLIKRIISEGRLELLDVQPKDAAVIYPHLFKQLTRKNLKIEEIGGDEQ